MFNSLTIIMLDACGFLFLSFTTSVTNINWLSLLCLEMAILLTEILKSLQITQLTCLLPMTSCLCSVLLLFLWLVKGNDFLTPINCHTYYSMVTMRSNTSPFLIINKLFIQRQSVAPTEGKWFSNRVIEWKQRRLFSESFKTFQSCSAQKGPEGLISVHRLSVEFAARLLPFQLCMDSLQCQIAECKMRKCHKCLEMLFRL